MLQTICYQNFLDLLKKDLYQNRRYIVCPTGEVADAFRAGLIRCYSGAEVFDAPEVITFSFFFSLLEKKLLRKSGTNERLLRRKSELLGFLGAHLPIQHQKSWKFFDFHRNFQRLTELRGFTLDEAMLSDFFLLHGPKDAEMLMMMNTILTTLDLWDEHRLTSEMTSEIRMKQEGALPNFALFGVHHLTAIQIDWLSAYVLSADVDILVPAQVWKERSPSDWISWLNFGNHCELSSHDSEKDCVKRPEINLCCGPMIELGPASYSEFSEPLPPVAQIITSEKCSLDEILEFSVREGRSKWSNDHLQSRVVQIRSDIELALGTGRFYWPKVKDLILETIMGPERRSPLTAKLLLALENYQALLQKDEWSPLQWEIFWSIFELDLPKLSFFQNSAQDAPRLFLLPEVLGLEGGQKVQLFAPLKNNCLELSSGAEYLIEIESILKDIGPLYNAQLKVLYHQTLILSLKESFTLQLYVDEDLWEVSDFFQKEFSSGCSVENVTEIKRNINMQPIGLGQSPVQFHRLTPSRLQRYIDCPLKFSLHYSQLLPAKTHPFGELSAFERGIFWHLCVEKSWEKSCHLTDSEIEQILNTLVSDWKRNLSPFVFQKEIAIALPYYQNAIYQLKQLVVSLHIKTVLFEKSLKTSSPLNAEGRIDIVLLNKENIYLVDLKSSSFGIPKSLKEVENFESIQMLFYRWLLGKSAVFPQTLKALIYINMADETQGLVLGLEDFTLSDFPGRQLRLTKDNMEFEQKLVEWQQLMSSSPYRAKPRNPEMCSYCEFEIICPKSSSSVEAKERLI